MREMGRRPTWREYSFDSKLFSAYFVCVFLLFMLGAALSIEQQIAIVGGLSAVLIGLSVWYRRKNDWHWPGTSPTTLLIVMLILAGGLLFVGSGLPRSSLFDPHKFPWVAGVGGITLLWILFFLRIYSPREAEFRSFCGNRPVETPQALVPEEPSWKRVVRTVFFIYFFACWGVGIAFHWKYSTTFRDGAPERTAERTVSLVDHGHVVYITPEEEKSLSDLRAVDTIGTTSAILLFLAVQLWIGVLPPALARRLTANKPASAP